MPPFDRKYFDKWYRNTRRRLHGRAALLRQGALALSAAEYLLERPVRTVLDVGCGEGAWEPVIRALRPRARYTGIEPSAYAVARYGAWRNIRQGSFGAIGELADLERFDLVLCVDVLHYVPRSEIERGACALGERLQGLALLHAFARGDEIEGDQSGFMGRSARVYRDAFRGAGLTEVGLGCWAGRALAERLSALEAPCGFR
ncbi:MAG: methyltransferase domain-containing protein [Gemmatimonadales bacterium]